MKCCFCNAVIDGMGNSIHPIKRGRNARCCDECNVKQEKINIFVLNLFQLITYFTISLYSYIF